MSEKIIRLMLSCGQIEEGVLENWEEVDPSDNTLWAVISIKGNPNKKLRIKKEYIAAYQIEEDVSLNKKPIQIEAVTQKFRHPHNIRPFIKAKFIAEQNHIEEKHKEVSEEYAEEIYAPTNAMLRRV